MTTRTNKAIEIWRQDPIDQDLWHGENGLMINQAALKERAAYFDITPIPTANFVPVNRTLFPACSQP